MQIDMASHYRSSDFYDNERSPGRTVVFYELEYYAGGEGFSVIDGVKYPHRVPHFLLVRPGCERFSVGKFDCLYAHFESDEPELSEIPTCIEANPADRAVELLSQTVELFSKTSPLRSMSVLCLLLSELRERSNVTVEKSEPYMERILATKQYIDRNYQSHITLDTLAALSYLSKNFYRTTFARIMEVSPTVYLKQVRVSHALELLKNSDLGFAEIALSCGFESQSYMNYVLRRETGKTPGELRADAQP